MWKPGTTKPPKSPQTPSSNKRQEPTNKKHETPKQDVLGTAQIKSGSSSSSSAKKRLTGATLNMKFMKRKKETQEYEDRRKSSGSKSRSSAIMANNPSPRAVAAAPEKDDDPMDVDEQNDNRVPFARATPAEMYGMQSALIGRRSFGGFNAAMEEAWKESKAALEDTQLEKPKKKVSDEELIQRYQELVDKRSDKSRPVGNLIKKRKQR